MNIEDRVNRMSVDLQKLVEKAAIWQSLFDECPLGVAVFDAEMQFFLINDAFTTMTGYRVEEIIGKDVKRVIPDRFKKLHRKAEKQFSAKPEKKTNRHGLTPYIVKNDGEELLVDIDLSYIRYDGSTYYVAFIRRIS